MNHVRPSSPPPTPSPISKDRKPNWHRKKSIESKILRALHQRIGQRDREVIAWSLLKESVDNASLVLGEDSLLIKELNLVVANRDVKGYLNLGSKYGSPTSYGDAASYFAGTSTLSLFKKASFWKADGLDPLASAKVRFELAERYCRLTNRRLRHYRRFDYADSRPLTQRLRLHEVFHLARRKISTWLGPLDVQVVLSGMRFGPGGTLSLSRPRTQPYHKLPRDTDKKDTVSPRAYLRAAGVFSRTRSLYLEALEALGIDTSSHDECPVDMRFRAYDLVTAIADYNKVTFVPKNAKTHRAIAIEPDWNIQFQLAVGDFFKSCLRKAGIDLTDQSRNQALALEGSLDDGPYGPVTIDLEMASDTLCIELVRELLPPEWFELLDSLRSHNGRLDGSEFRWEKFSSMGNGFTFELESMIFYALAQACSDLSGSTEYFFDTYGPRNRYGFVSVFGDDIIVPKLASSHLISVLRFCGFRVNYEKTFTDGPFRESCGADFWYGTPVRPFYYDGDLGHGYDLVQLRNLCVSNATHPLGRDFVGVSVLSDLLVDPVVYQHLRSPYFTLGFDALYFSEDECHTSYLVVYDPGYQCFIYPSISFRSRAQRFNATRGYRAVLYSLSLRGSGYVDSSRSWELMLPSTELRMTFRSF